MNNVEDNLIQLQIQKEVTTLFKFYLELLEQLKLPTEQHDALRKLVLNHSNDSIRLILQFLDLFDFQINPQKVKEATQRRITFTKTIVSHPITIL